MENNCCTIQPKDEIKCPHCTYVAKGVLEKTLNHLLKDDIKLKLQKLNGFHFCKNELCDIVYFKENQILMKNDIKIKLDKVCYCFNWSEEKIETEINNTGKSSALDDIKYKMKNQGCACEILNPSGSCCLADVKKVVKYFENEHKKS